MPRYNMINGWLSQLLFLDMFNLGIPKPMQLLDLIYHSEFVKGKCKGTAEQKSVDDQAKSI